MTGLRRVLLPRLNDRPCRFALKRSFFSTLIGHKDDILQVMESCTHFRDLKRCLPRLKSLSRLPDQRQASPDRGCHPQPSTSLITSLPPAKGAPLNFFHLCQLCDPPIPFHQLINQPSTTYPSLSINNFILHIHHDWT